MFLGAVPIRIAVNSAPEVVWCHRLDPARARIANIPLPDTGRRHGDLLLIDGAPAGYRRLGGRQVPVFEELTVLEASPSRTIVLSVTAPTSADTAALGALAESAGWAWEDWTQSIELLCKQCSEGVPHEHHERPEPPWSATRRFAIAIPPLADPEAMLRTWVAAGGGREALVDAAGAP